MFRLPLRCLPSTPAPVLLVALVILEVTAPAQSIRLNGSLAQPGTGDVVQSAFSRDGTRVVYIADQEADQVFELFSVPTDRSQPPLRISAPLVQLGDVFEFALGQGRAVYSASQNVPGLIELFSAPLDGSAPPIRLNPDPAPFGFTYGRGLIQVSADGAKVVFSFFDQTAGVERLFSVPIDGSQPALEIAATGAPPQAFGTSAVTDLAITTDGTRAVFVSTIFDDELSPATLFQVPLDGSQPALQISGGADRELRFALAENGSRVAFTGGITNQTELFVSALDGSQRVRLNTPGKAVDKVQVSPDGSRVLFVEGFTPVVQLVSATSDGTQRVLVGPPGPLPEIAVAPDWSRVVFQSAGSLFGAPISGMPGASLLAWPDVGTGLAVSADSATIVFTVEDSFRALRAMPITGGGARLLNGPPAPDRGVVRTSPVLALGASRVVYRQDRDSDEVFELFSVPLDGSQAEVRLSNPLIGARDVQSFQLSPDRSRALYVADQDDDETFELFGVPVVGGAPAVRYNAPLPGGPVQGDVLAFLPAAGAGRVIYYADQDDDQVFDLYAASLDGEGGQRRLSVTLTGNGSVFDFAVSPGGAHAVFLHMPAVGALHPSLYAVATGGDSVPVLLDGPGEFPLPFAFAAGETRAVYRRAGAGGGSHDLVSAPLDGSAGAIPLHPVWPDLPASRTVTDFQLTPDRSMAVFRADHRVEGVFELFVVPVDGSAPPARIGELLGGAADVTSFAVSPDGARVVYLVDPGVDEQFELFSAPIDGGRARRLSARLVAGGDVTGFRIDSGGRIVVYRADQRFDGRFELFSVPAAGRRPPLRALDGTARSDRHLLTPLDAGRSVQPDFALSADGEQVLYRADARTAGKVELFRAATDGGGAPVVLSGPLVSTGDVNSFALAPDQEHVVYLADQRANEVFELFGVPLAGGPAVALDTMPPQGDVLEFRIAPDSRFVAYRADRDTDNAFDLYGALLDGSGSPRKLNGPLAAGGDVQADFVVLLGGRVLYRADQDADDVFELYESFFGRARQAPRLR